MILPTLMLFTASTLDLTGRIAIIRALASEFVTLKVPLPVSAEGLTVDSQGEFDWKLNESRVIAAKQSLAPGEKVQVTSIAFTADKIIFQLNGGVKKNKRKILERIQISGGGGGRQVGAAPDGAGSYVTIQFPDNTPDLTPEEVKVLLASVLDFSKKSALNSYLDQIPEEFREAVKNKQAQVGMDKDLVLAALGRPMKRIRERSPEFGETEDWIYGERPMKVTFVKFSLEGLNGARVISVKTF